MRTEELMNEAKAYTRERSAYIHVEVMNGKHGTAIVSGDPAGLVVTIFSLVQAFAQKCVGENGTFTDLCRETKKCLKSLNKLYRIMLKTGGTVFDSVYVEGGDEEDDA